MSGTAVDRLHLEYATILEILDKSGEVSLRGTADDCFRKLLLLSAASLFETRVCDAIVAHAASACGASRAIAEFVRTRGVARQYHTMFDWKARTANQFFGFFGASFKSSMDNRLASDPDLRESIAAFMELGESRNRLVHGDLATFTLEKTAEEIFDLYKRGELFVDALPRLLTEYGRA